jgi:hypothetical protein
MDIFGRTMRVTDDAAIAFIDRKNAGFGRTRIYTKTRSLLTQEEIKGARQRRERNFQPHPGPAFANLSSL